MLSVVRSRLGSGASTPSLVFLGDYLGGPGLPDSGSVARPESEAALEPLISLARQTPGRVLFLPGHAAWRSGRSAGLDGVLRLERYVEAAVGRGDVFRPSHGFPGPIEVEIADDVVLLLIDTQWFLSPADRALGDAGPYDVDEPEDALLYLEDLLIEHRHRTVIVAGHHPLRSNGPHAGRFPIRRHVFPLTAIWSDAYLPLPLVGSALPLYRRFIGRSQDLANSRYASLRGSLSRLFKRHEALVYVAGHDPGLQHFDDPAGELVISGGGAGAGFVARGHGATLAAGVPGFVLLHVYPDGETWLEAVQVDPTSTHGETIFVRRLLSPRPEAVDPFTEPPQAPPPDLADSTVVVAANRDYAAPAPLQWLVGKRRRAAWSTPVQVPVFDIDSVRGGLRILKRGGSAQTISVRLADSTGHQYVLRSVDKSFRKKLERFGSTLAADLLQDQMAQLHPYAALIVPPLAYAGGIFHADPRLYYVPDDPRFGIYRDDVANQLFWFETRPDEDMSDDARFGHAPDVIGSSRLYQEINADNDFRVDARAFARARLFDMLIADWDRYEDQWRWAEFEPPDRKGKIYRPIPRDRDWAFFRFDGLFAPVAKIYLPLYQDFRASYGYLPGLNERGLRQDRRFLAALARQDWIEIADSLREALSDSVITAAVARWPEPIRSIDGPETARLLRLRRDQLADVAERYYTFLARVPEVVGSHKHERFEVYREQDGTTTVSMYKTSKEGEIRKLLFRRRFDPAETEEIRLFGQDGNDAFVVTGRSSTGPRVIGVGGPGVDRFEDRSSVAGPSRRTWFIDTPEGNEWDVGPETRVTRTWKLQENRYRPSEDGLDRTLPLTFLGSNSDDGFFLGGGVLVTRHGFHREPVASRHRIVGNVSLLTGAANLRYEALFAERLGGWDIETDLVALLPGSFRNFYGLGNETSADTRDARYYQAKITQVAGSGMLVRSLQRGLRFGIGPRIEHTTVRRDSLRSLAHLQEGITSSPFGGHTYMGLDAELEAVGTDRSLNPRQGFRWSNRAAINLGLGGDTDTYARFASTLTLYVSPRLSPQLTLALRTGVAHHAGSFPFHVANTLGGKSNLRGFRSTRFAGRSAAFSNAEVRAKLLNYRTYLAIGEFGLLAFFDTGRVWTDGESSRTWHRGAGGGIWLSVFDSVVLRAERACSVEGRTFTVSLGFQY